MQLRGTTPDTHQQADLLYVIGVRVRELAPFLGIGTKFWGILYDRAR